MKKLALFLCLALMLTMLAACGSTASQSSSQPTSESTSESTTSESTTSESTTSESSSEATGQTEIPNPYHDATAADFEALGITLKEPDGAENVVYNTIDGEPVIAQIEFTLDGATYTLRGAKTSEDICGVYLEWNDETVGVNADYADHGTEITLKTNEEGGRLAVWNWGDTTFSLFTTEAVSDDTLSTLALTMAENSYHK